MNRWLRALLLASVLGCSSTGTTSGTHTTPEPEPETCDVSTICEQEPIPSCDDTVSGVPLSEELQGIAEGRPASSGVVVVEGFIRPSALNCTAVGCTTPCCNACGAHLLLLPAPDAERDDGDARLWLSRAGERLSCSERCCAGRARVCCPYQSEGPVLVAGQHRVENGTRYFDLISICQPAP